MTPPIGPDGPPHEAPHLTARATGAPRPAVSILSDLNPGRVRLAPAAARPGRWKWVLPPLLTALVGGAFLLGRQAPGPAPAPDAPLDRPRPPIADALPPLRVAPPDTGGGAIIREPSPAPTSLHAPDTPDTPASPGASGASHPPPHPTSRHRPPGPHVAGTPTGTTEAPRSPPQPGRSAERDVDIITAIVR